MFKIYELTPKFNFKIWPKKLKFIKFPKNDDDDFFIITPSKQKYLEMKTI